MVTNTPGFTRLEYIIGASVAVVWLLHLSLPAAPSPTAEGSSSSGSAGAPSKAAGGGIDEGLGRLIAMRNAGDLTAAEFAAAKAFLLEAPTPTAVVAPSPSPSKSTTRHWDQAQGAGMLAD